MAAIESLLPNACSHCEWAIHPKESPRTMHFSRKFQLALVALSALSLGAFAQDMPQTATFNGGNPLHPSHEMVAPHDHTNGQAHARFGINGIDSVPNFNGHYFADGFTADNTPQREWFYNMVGNPPQLGGTTTLNAPVVPVDVVLLNKDKSVFFTVPATNAIVNNTLQSPIFQNSFFDDSPAPTQVTDAVQRAEFDKKAKSDWHTMLAASLKPHRTMVVPAGNYTLFTFSDGSYAFTLIRNSTFSNLLFPPTDTDTTSPIGAAEHAGDITTKDVSTFLFNNIFLSSNGTLTGSCCVLGFHSYDLEPGDAKNGNQERRYVVNYSSWITPGLFGAGFEDVTATSHEIAESINDPFVASDNVHDVTPIWLAPNGNCQNNLEDGDVIEGLSNATFPILMPNGFTYHPQNEALLQWFEFQTNPDSFQGAYSYPNTKTLTALSPGPLDNTCSVVK
jgi:hypothetical protein